MVWGRSKRVNGDPEDDHGSFRLQRHMSSGSGVGVEKTIVEKKCLLINEAIDSMGMGKYQWCIWFLCGLGYFIDLLVAQAFGLVLSPIQQEFGFSDDQTGNISVSFSAGLTAGAFVWGVLVDIVGRRWAFNLTVFISGIFALCLGIPDSYNQFLVLTAFVGIGVGGNIPIDTTITLEFIPQNRRSLLALLSLFQPIGVMVCSGIAYALIPANICEPDFTRPHALPSCYNVEEGTHCCRKEDNMGWRYFLYTIGAIIMCIFIARFVVFRMQESPKFYVYKGQDEKAIKVLDTVAKFNGQTNHITLDIFRELDGQSRPSSSDSGGESIPEVQVRKPSATFMEKVKIEASRYKLLFANPTMTRLTILVWLTYASDYAGFTIAGTYLPRILALKNAELDLDLRYTYRSYIYIYTPGIAGVALGAFCYHIPQVGRKWTMVISSGMMGISIFIFSAVNDEASNIGLNIMEYFFQSMFNGVLYGWTPEAYPAPIRGTAAGVASFWGRLFGIVSPLIAQHLYGNSGNANSVLYLAGGWTLGCVLFTALLPNSSMGTQSL